MPTPQDIALAQLKAQFGDPDSPEGMTLPVPGSGAANPGSLAGAAGNPSLAGTIYGERNFPVKPSVPGMTPDANITPEMVDKNKLAVLNGFLGVPAAPTTSGDIIVGHGNDDNPYLTNRLPAQMEPGFQGPVETGQMPAQQMAEAERATAAKNSPSRLAAQKAIDEKAAVDQLSTMLQGAKPGTKAKVPTPFGPMELDIPTMAQQSPTRPTGLSGPIKDVQDKYDLAKKELGNISTPNGALLYHFQHPMSEPFDQHLANLKTNIASWGKELKAAGLDPDASPNAQPMSPVSDNIPPSGSPQSALDILNARRSAGR